MTMILACSEKENLVGEIFSAAQGLATQLGGEAALVELDEVKPSIKVNGKIILLKANTLLSNNPELATAAITELSQKKRRPDHTVRNNAVRKTGCCTNSSTNETTRVERCQRPKN